MRNWLQVLIPSSLHQVSEGHLGAYWRGGALLKIITESGFHLKMPFTTQYESVKVTLQTDTVTNIPCGTKGGVMINFTKIEVVNQLHKEYVYETLLKYGVHFRRTWIHDKIHHHINQFCTLRSFQQVYIDDFNQIGENMKEALQVDCTKYAPGIEIISVHVPKPTIPESISCAYVRREEERIKVLMAVEIAKRSLLKFIEIIGEIAKRSLVKYVEAIVETAKRHLVQYVPDIDEIAKRYLLKFIEVIGEIAKRSLMKYVEAIVETAKRHLVQCVPDIAEIAKRLFQCLQLLVARFFFRPAQNMIR